MVETELSLLEDNIPLKQFFKAQPDPGDEQFANLIRRPLINKIRSEVPNLPKYTYGYPFTASDVYRSLNERPYRDYFFPNYKPVTYENELTTILFPNNWWKQFSYVLIAQYAYHHSKRIKNKLNYNTIKRELSYFNNELLESIVNWYSYLISNAYSTIAQPYKDIGDHKQALQKYRDTLIGDAWIALKRKQYVDGTWKNPEWELFHHWIKLNLLTMPVPEINSLIQKIRDKDLAIPSTVDETSWRQYRVWFNPPGLDYNDISDLSMRNGDDELFNFTVSSTYRVR